MKKFQKLIITGLITLSLPMSGCSIIVNSNEDISGVSESISEANSSENPAISSYFSSISENVSSSSEKIVSSQEREFTGISFKSNTFTYDGEKHSIYVEGAPDFADVSYQNNNQSEIGTYKVIATISAPNYKTLTLKANLVIEGKKFTGITFEDKEFADDGKYHSIYVEGAPDFADVSYQNNNQYRKGTYVVTATISAKNYQTLVLKATMTISRKLPDAILLDRTLIYTGNDQRIIYSMPDNVPNYTEASFKVDGKVVSEENFAVKTVGEHTVSVTLTNTDYDYSPSTIIAKINVIENNVAGVNTSKNPLKIDENLKYSELRSKILEGNFTLKQEYFDDYFYPDGSTKSVLSDTTYFYVDGDEAFEFFSYPEYSEFMENQTHYRHTKLCGNEVKSAYFEDGILDGGYWDSSYKMDAGLYQENIIGRIGLKAIYLLNESENGEFEAASEGGSHTSYGSFEIDEKNNRFIEDVRIHYYHPEFDHDEHTRYTIYNVGNTSINVPEALDASKINLEYEEKSDFYINGMHYSTYDNEMRFDPVLDACSVTYLPSGSYVIPAIIGGLPVLGCSTSYYGKYYDNDCSGYTFKAYFDSYGYYQGEYEYLGRISGYNDIYKLIDDGATVLFYGEW